MPNHHVLFVSDPRPAFSDHDWVRYQQIANSIGTGRGLPFKRPKPATVPDAWSYLKDNPAPALAHVTGLLALADGELSPRDFARGGIKSVETHRGEETDEWGNVLPFEVGSEVVMSAYRGAEQARLLLETHEERIIDKRRVLVPREVQKHVRGYTFPADRFRPFSQEPYFPDTTDFHRVNADRTKWNNYRLGEAIPGTTVIVSGPLHWVEPKPRFELPSFLRRRAA